MINNLLAKWHVLCLITTKRTIMKKHLLICLILVIAIPFFASAQTDSQANIIYGAGNPVAAVTTQKIENGKVLVKWAVENAGLISYVTVERSEDGVHYTAISKKLSANNNINAFVDGAVGTAFYRIAFVKKDGITFYGQVNDGLFTIPAP
ncbi:MAG: hypothetical protein EAZ16_09655 [Sphingobacteriales bacterium]|nr:MAG: hypothetical protein EAZ16_09655 [Sphingobacteriales bacterium]